MGLTRSNGHLDGSGYSPFGAHKDHTHEGDYMPKVSEIPGYNASRNQTLRCEAGILKWVSDASARLMEMTLSDVDISGFSPDTTSYTGLQTTASSATLTYSTEDSGATVTVKLDGVAVEESTIQWNGTEGETNENVLTVKVESGSETKTYSFTVSVDWTSEAGDD